MDDKLQQNIEKIEINDIINGITEKNKHYFVFFDSPPNCLRDRKIHLQLSLMVGCFIATFFVKEDYIFYIGMSILTALICLWYTYSARYTYYYKKAYKALLFNKNKKATKYFYKMLNGKRLYIENMPLAYNILKAKTMLKERDFKAAEYLAVKVSEQIQSCPQALLDQHSSRYIFNDITADEINKHKTMQTTAV